MKRIYWNDVKSILKVFLIIVIPILIITLSNYNHFSKVENEKTKELIIGEQKQRATVIEITLEEEMAELNEDLFVIKHSNELVNYINNHSAESLLNAEQMFLRMVGNKKSFDQIRFIDKDGNEVIRVNNREDGPDLVPDEELQNKRDRYYYTKTSRIHEDEVYVTDMDLNIENGKIEIPFKPMVRIASPLYSHDGEYQGILIINYLGEDLLRVFAEQFKELDYTIIHPSLINMDGYYLSTTDTEKNFAFMFDKKKRQSLEYEDPELWRTIQSKESGSYQSGSDITFFMKINPLAKLNVADQSDYSWYIISQFNLNDLPIIQNTFFFGMNVRDILLLAGLVLLIFMYITIFYYSGKDKEQLSITNRVAENTNDAVVITDQNTRILYVNQAFEKATGYRKEEVLGLKTNYFKSNKQTREFYHEMWKSINTKGCWEGELWDRKKDGMLYPKKLNIFAIKSKPNLNAVKYIGIFTDLTELKEKQKNVDWLQNYNIETNLPNENLLVKLIESGIRNSKKTLYLIYFSIENYHSVILTVKEEKQLFINHLIERIRDILREEDFIAQISRRNFVIGLSSYSSDKEIEMFLREFFEKSQKPLPSDETEFYFDIKAGISKYPEDAVSANELIVNSYIALENALKKKEKKYLYYTLDLKVDIEREIEMNLLLKKAIVNGELDVYYQPQVEIGSGKISGAEALLRWDNEKLGMVSPAVFISVAEKTGQIIEIGDWVMERVFRDFSELKDRLDPNFRISINLSPLQLTDPELLDKLENLADKYEVSFQNFEVEITENVLMTDLSSVNDALNQFKALGMTIAIDDFGTGYSSLSYLKNLNIDKLKIDRNFIKDYPVNDNGEIAQIITNLAHSFKLEVITEGAETKEQIEYLQSIGCNLVQGYYYSKPLTKEHFCQYVSRN